MTKLFVLFTMVFMHTFDDYYLQGCLAKLKQKSFWENDPIGKNPLYKYDYLIALAMHAFSWTFCIMLPIIIYTKLAVNPVLFISVFLINMTIHLYIDNLKANKHTINLVIDQSIHIIQVIVTFLIFIVCIK